ncbi:MAG: T9SS type A sorting domain-containing protein [Ignavibacteria bacterium]|nr:T9SS type A sorting domain-containing protein [Ignavibacteria bacterium]
MTKYLLLLIFFPASLFSQIDSLRDLLNYYPLQSENYWEYKRLIQQIPYPPDSSAYSVEVKGDTLLGNNRIYKILLFKDIYPNHNIYYNFERIDSLSGSVFRYNNDAPLTNYENKIDSLFAQPGDTINSSRAGYTSFGYFQTICNSIDNDTVLGVQTETKTYFDQSFMPGEEYKLAKGFGYYSSSSCEFSCGWTFLVYAKISGIEYGSKIITSVVETKTVPDNYQLYQNYPNPFNPVTTITYQIPKEGLVTLKIYDILGKEVTTLINEEKQAGKYSIDFNASSAPMADYQAVYICMNLVQMSINQPRNYC